MAEIQSRNIVVIVGSDSDLPQLKDGLLHLASEQQKGSVEVLSIKTMSIHRNTGAVLAAVRTFSEEGNVDVLIVAAGWANHLTGTIDAYLRYTLKDNHIVVIGIACQDPDSVVHGRAASLSISEVPGTQVFYKLPGGRTFFGAEGALAACKFAATGELPEIKLKEPKPTMSRTLAATLSFITEREKTQ